MRLIRSSSRTISAWLGDAREGTSGRLRQSNEPPDTLDPALTKNCISVVQSHWSQARKLASPKLMVG